MLFNFEFIENNESFNLEFNESKESFDLDFGETTSLVGGGIEIYENGIYNVSKYANANVNVKALPVNPYEGEYNVKPKFISQMLETKNKSLIDNIIIDEIYISRTDNLSGGKTIFIGVE